MSKNANFRKILNLTQLSVLVALLLIFGFTSIGYIKVGAIEITMNVIPVAIGAIVLGPGAGAALGTVFGLTSFWQCLGTSAFGVAIFNANPIFAFIVCVIPRLLEGLLTGLAFKAMSKKAKNNSLPCTISSILCPVLNTVLFVGGFILLYSNSSYFSELYTASGANNIIAFISWFVALNGVIEIAVCFVVSTAVSKALLTVTKRLS